MHRVLQDVKVLSFAQVISGPSATRMLVDLGADVIKVESRAGDVMRGIRPVKKDARGKVQSGIFVALNTGQRSVAIDLGREEGVAVARRLILEWADVVVANFTPGTLAKHGLDYETVQREKPSIIYGEISGYGQRGPWSSRRAFDICVQAECGITAQNGPWNGRPHRVGFSAVDYLVGRDLTIGILGALHHRERTGKGQHVDCSMYNSGLTLLEYAIPGVELEDVVAGPVGDRHPSAAPHNLYETQDGYINIIVINDKLWERLIEVMERPDLRSDPRVATAKDRIRNVEYVDSVVESWTRTLTTEEAAKKLTDAKLPSGVLCKVTDVIASEQTRYWNMAPVVEQPHLGPVRINGCPIKYSDATTDVRGPAPLLGQHNEDVLCGVLGLSKADYRALLDGGVLFSE